jgi:hypothetical protein
MEGNDKNRIIPKIMTITILPDGITDERSTENSERVLQSLSCESITGKEFLNQEAEQIYVYGSCHVWDI